MKRFKYRLERVLHFRKLTEAQAKRALQLAQRDLAEAQSALEVLQSELVRDFDLSEKSTMRIEEFWLISTYREGLKSRIEIQSAKIEELKAIVVERMAKYREAAKELESLVRHRATKLTEYDHEVSLAEQAQVDELMVQRHQRH